MARKNNRVRHHSPPIPILHTSPKRRCAYCGRSLHRGDWHWMRDVFGQKVRKCNNERECYKHRSYAAELAYKDAMEEVEK